MSVEGLEQFSSDELIAELIHRQAAAAKGPAGALPLYADVPPIRIDEGGAVRVGNSRISLDVVVEQYENGATPEDMVRAYDTLALADVHAAIAYHLRHREQVAAYLQQRRVEAETLRSKVEADGPRLGRAELLDRRSARDKDHASTGQ